MIEMIAGLGVWIGLLAFLAAIADAIDKNAEERADARKRNPRR